MNPPLALLRRQGRVVWLHDRLSAPPAPAPDKPAAQAPAAPEHPVHPVHPAPPPSSPAPPAFRMMGNPAPAAPQAPGTVQAHADAALFDISRGARRDFCRAEEAAHYLGFWQHDASALRELRQALQRLEPSTWVFSHPDARVISQLAAHMAQGSLVVTESAQPTQPAGLPGVPAPPAAPAAAPLAQAIAPIKPPLPPLLPILEEVQIEGAEVLPEIMQSLEQIDLTLGELKLAPVSLAPTPSKIPEIDTAMRTASSSVTATLDKL